MDERYVKLGEKLDKEKKLMREIVAKRVQTMTMDEIILMYEHQCVSIFPTETGYKVMHIISEVMTEKQIRDMLTKDAYDYGWIQPWMLRS